MLAYHAQLNSEDDETRLRAARAWTKWEMWTSKLHVDPAQVAEADDNDWSKCVFPSFHPLLLPFPVLSMSVEC